MTDRFIEGGDPSRHVSRRSFLHGVAGGGLLLTGGGLLSACGDDGKPRGGTPASSQKPRAGGILVAGIGGGGPKDSVDAHFGFASNVDVARSFQLYDELATYNADFEFELALAEEITPNAKADEWTVRLRKGVVFHDGKPVTAEDVIFSLRRITDPKSPGVGAAGLGSLDPKGMRKRDDRTVTLRLKEPFAVLDQELAQHWNGIVPVGYDPKKPVGTGPFKFASFIAGESSLFVRNDDYWREGEPHLDEVKIVDLADPTARLNALLAGQVDVMDDLPYSQVKSVEANAQLQTLVAKTGNWLPFTMRVDQAPFDDVRVRRAMRLLVDREQMINQTRAGQATVGNDLYSPFDSCFAKDLPQRTLDIEQAKSLLAQAGQRDLRVELIVAPVSAGLVEAAQVLAEQAKAAGVQVRVKTLDSGSFFGDNYLKYTFSMDIWKTRNYIPQVAVGSLPQSPYNETHWPDDANKRFVSVYAEARRTLDDAKRCEMLQEMQRMEYESGGHIVWSFNNQVDAARSRVQGLTPYKRHPLGDYGFRRISLA